MSTQHILLVEDDESLGSTLTENLVLEGFTVDWIRDGQLGLESAQKGIHHLIILDVMLPRLSGLEVLKEFRKHSKSPVLLISARGTTGDRIAGLEQQADDYLPKPFHLREFLLRVQNLIRRSQLTGVGPKRHDITIGRAIFNFDARTVCNHEGQIEVLTDKEIKLLQLLLSREGHVINRKEILDLVWGFNQFPTTRTVDNMIVRLRRWIELDPSHPQFIISHRGVGYCLQLGNHTRENS